MQRIWFRPWGWLFRPVSASGSIIVLLGALLMLYMVLRSGAEKRA